MRKIGVILLVVGVALLGMAACDDGDASPEEEPADETGSWVLVEEDSFFVASAQALPGSAGPYRYQINFATRAQLTQTNNDNETPSTFAIQLAFAQKPTTTGSFSFTNDRFTITSTELNLYQTFFVGTGHERENKNYLSPGTGTVTVTIENGKLRSDLGELVMVGEADAADTFTLKWSLDLDF